MKPVGASGWKKAGLMPAMENGSLWVTVAMRTRDGPTALEQRFRNELENASWKVTFSANWWSSSYGVAMFEAEREEKKKVLVVKWTYGELEGLFEVRGTDERGGRKELYEVIEMVSDDLMYDSVLRNMMDRY